MSNVVRLDIVGDASSLERATKQAGSAARRLGDDAEVGQKKWSKAFAGIGTAAVAAGALVGKALFDFAKDSIAAFTESQEAQEKLNDAFSRFPKLADTNIDKLHELNQELAKKTIFDDDAFASGQAVLAQFDLTGKQLQEITPLLADYAAKTGMDLPSAAESLGKAFLGNTRALKELGIEYTATGDSAKDIPAIMDLLNQKVGGFAEKQGKTAAGQAKILSNQFGELKEQVGEKLLPVMVKAAEVGLKVVDWISKNKEVVLPLIGVIAAVTIATWLWNLALAANPIGLIIIGIAALIAGIILLVKNWDTVWGAIVDAAKAVGQWFVDVFWHGFFEKIFTWIYDKQVAVFRFFKELPGKIGGWLSGIGEVIKNAFLGAFNWINDKFNWLIRGANTVINSLNKVPGINLPNIPLLPTVKMHTGGRVPGLPGQESLAILQGGETVVPAGGSAGGMTLTIRSGGSRLDDLLVELLRKAIADQGGNVQAVLGRGF